MTITIDCPCGHARPFADCCERFIDGLLVPETAEELMRSRYAAYARGYVDYLVATHDPKTRVPALRENVAKWAASARFTSLTILDTEAGLGGDDKGTVEFEATYVEGGESRTLRERSRFRRHQGRWVYIAGTTPGQGTVRRDTPRVGRNAPCPCGSGKKYKRCCGRA